MLRSKTLPEPVVGTHGSQEALLALHHVCVVIAAKPGHIKFEGDKDKGFLYIGFSV